MCTREDLLRLTLQEGCWYNLRSRKALEDSKGHTTKSPLVTAASCSLEACVDPALGERELRHRLG